MNENGSIHEDITMTPLDATAPNKTLCQEDPFKQNANKVINFKFFRDAKDWTGNADQLESYNPLMTYQIFENEVIFGYKDLEINIYVELSSGQCCIEVNHTDLMFDERLNIRPDDVYEKLAKWFPQGFVRNLKEFDNVIMHPDVTVLKPPFGVVIAPHIPILSKAPDKEFVITACNNLIGDFKKFHARFEPIMIFYIERANFIEIDDPRWGVFHIYEKVTEGSETKYYLAGFCSVFRFLTDRARISQMMILPPYQKKGLGLYFLQIVYHHLNSLKTIKEITVESPNQHFSILRNKVDCCLLLELDEFSKENVKDGFSKQMIKAAKSKYKLNKGRCRVLYDILLLYYTDTEDQLEFRDFKDQMMERLVEQVKFQYKRFLCISSQDEENIQYLHQILTDPQERLPYLEDEFKAFMERSMPVVNYLKNFFNAENTLM